MRNIGSEDEDFAWNYILEVIRKVDTSKQTIIQLLVS